MFFHLLVAARQGVARIQVKAHGLLQVAPKDSAAGGLRDQRIRLILVAAIGEDRLLAVQVDMNPTGFFPPGQQVAFRAALRRIGIPFVKKIVLQLIEHFFLGSTELFRLLLSLNGSLTHQISEHGSG
ncbi:MAG: hypothetical protein BWY83_03041 [bacterium ADurb.Bin478]|nr:MAG: hypothetical protein BWY83_03041 [bacterium ADurb.Bin478]